MLNAHPQTLDVLLEASPHFNKLNNNILRKTFASRVTVEQAAKIADVDLESLVKKLNSSINIDLDKVESEEIVDEEKKNIENDKPDFLKDADEQSLKTLDVRPIIDSGKDPFLDIMNFIKELGNEKMFLLINSFEPIPLYSVLEKKGFDHFTEKDENVFKVYFFISEAAAKNKVETEDEQDKHENDVTNVIEIDVRELGPPEPMIKILETLPRVDNKTILLVHHHREPMMLYPKLEERGYQAVSNKMEENYYKVIITKK